MPNILYTVDEAAAYTGLSKHSIRRYVRIRELAPARQHPIMFTREELDRFNAIPRPQGRRGLPHVGKGERRTPPPD